MATLTVNGVEIPPPVSITADDEIIWSQNTGRMANGQMAGDVVAQKKTISISWGLLKEEELRIIRENFIAGFFPLTIHTDEALTIMGYRGNLTVDHIGKLGDGHYWYKSAKVKFIQK